MTEPHRNPAGGVVAECADESTCKPMTCATCLAEVPADAVNVTDAQDYVYHFCGLACLEAWQKQAASRQKPKPE